MADKTLVYVLFHETNTGHSDESDGYVEAIYTTEAAAETARVAAIRAAIADGRDVWFNPDAPEGEQEGPLDWTDDFVVLAFEMRTACDPRRGVCGECGDEVDFNTHDRDACGKAVQA